MSDAELRVALGARIAALRDAKGLSQPALATLAGLSGRAGTISNYEAGKRVPDAIVLGRIADALSTTTDELLGRDAEERADPIGVGEMKVLAKLLDLALEPDAPVEKLVRIARDLILLEAGSPEPEE